MAFLTEAANRGSISTGYDIDNSLKLESDNAEYIDNRHNSAGNQKTWTLSFWIKRTELGTTQKPYDAGNAASIAFLSSDKIQIENSNLYLLTNRVFRDTSAWYHIVQLNDSTQSTASNRAKLWINGVQETSFSSETYMTQNQDGNMNSATSVSIGGGGGAHVNGYMAELFFVDGQALAPTDFGEFDEDSGIWIPKEYGGTLSGTSIKLDFSNSSALWEDSSGLSGNGTVMSGVNISAADQATDTPTNNFCTINTIEYTGGYNITNGGTQAERNANTAWYSTTSSMGVSKGKWYWEAQFASGATSFMAGVSIDSYISTQSNPFDGQYLGSGSGDGGFGYNNSGTVFYNNTSTSGYGSAPSTNIIGLAIDMDNEKAYVSINGTWQNSGDPTSGATGTGAIDLFLDSNGDTAFFSLCAYNPNYTHKINFGGYTTMSISSAASDANGYGTFEYAPPSGYYSICSQNLAEYG